MFFVGVFCMCHQGIGVFGAEYLAGRLMGLDPLQTVIPWTLGEEICEHFMMYVLVSRKFLQGVTKARLLVNVGV